jgi:aminocarboxymuconate-semialdehyde decarboxylase
MTSQEKSEPFQVPSRVVDVHTHMYPPPYIDLLKSRNTVPYIRASKDSQNQEDLRLIILPGEELGRPVGPSYWDVSEKLSFMKQHKINVSVVSLANPWLDFITDAEEATKFAHQINDWFNSTSEDLGGQMYFFAVLPMRAPIETICAEIRRVHSLKWCRGVVMGTTGAGFGLDDPAFVPIWEALAENQTMVFLHPHYGLPSEVFGPRAEKFGHVLPLALGFPLETTIAITRMILTGIFAKLPGLRILLAHSGGTLPFLAGRIQSCINHDAHFMKTGEHKVNVWDILKNNIFLDAVIYDQIGLKAAAEAVSSKRVMFGKFPGHPVHLAMPINISFLYDVTFIPIS